jgi:hypothetical protein
MCFPRAASIGVLILACCIASAPARCEDDLFGHPEDAAPEELYWEVLRLHAAGLLSEQTFAQVQRGLDVVEAHYAADGDHDDQMRRILVTALRQTYRAEPGDENAHLRDAQEGRAYARRLHSAGTREAKKYAQRTILIAGMLGVPTSKGELALIVALPAGGYLVGKVAALTYKKTALLLRKLRTPDEVLSRAGALGIRVERVESKAGLEGLIGKDAAASVDSALRAPEGLITAAGDAKRLAARFDPSRAGHIFREAVGHVNPASAESQARFARLFEEVASNPANLRADAVQAGLLTQQAAESGVQAFTSAGRTGQVWVTIRNGVIQNAGVNPPGSFR